MGLAGLMLVCAGVVPGELREEYHLDFRGGQPVPLELKPILNHMPIPNTVSWIRPEAEGLSIRLPAHRSTLPEEEGMSGDLPAHRRTLGSVGLATTFAVHGDFEITASYQLLSADEPESGFGVGVALQIKKANPSPEAAAVAWVVRAQGEETAVWDRATSGPEGKPRYKGGCVASSAREGRLRLRRTGRILSCLIAEGSAGEDFHEIHQEEFGTEDLERIVLQVVTGRQPCAVEARWLDFQVCSESLPSVAQPPGGAMAYWLALAIGGMVILGGSVDGWRRWQHVLN